MLEQKFNSAEVEARHYKDWEASGVFTAHPEKNTTPFTVMMPPPNVTGSLHMGHALNMTLQDILTRFYRMKGRDALWMPGTDHAGIATQMVVERQLDQEGVKRRDMGREAFLKRVWEWKAYSGGTITSQLRRLGATPDWSREAFTMDANLSRAVVKVFVQLHKEGLLYRDKRLVNWDPKFHSAISDLEVDQKEQKGHLWHIQYAIEGSEARTITVATTRPETLLGDTAIAVNPEDERYKDLIGKFAVVPIANRPIPIIADDYADPEHGSGAVKITPAHDFNDFEVGKRHNLQMINIFDINAHLNENVPEEYQGMERFAARKKILTELEELEVLEKVDNIVHTVPHGDRSGVVIEPYLTDQWYVDAKKMALPVADAITSGKTKLYPENWRKISIDWIDNLQPWCVSRQLWWGHQIPAWYDEDGGIYVAETEAEAQKQAGDKKLTRDEDVLDTWFSSALWPFSTLGWPEKTPELNKYYPGDVLVTGFDIIFFWVIRMMMMGIHFMGEVPFKEVYLHALVLDSKGQKMSKSKGNVIDPLTLIDKFGADALRFTMSSSAAMGRDIRMSEDRVEGYRNFTTKLWNAAKFCEMNGCILPPDDNYDYGSEAFTSQNIWIVSKLYETKEKIEQYLENYKFNEASNALYQFVWGTYCDWYLEILKPELDTEGMEITKRTAGWVLKQILILLNPFMPYVTEEIYTQIGMRGKNPSLLETKWPEYKPFKIPSWESSLKGMEWAVKFISEIRSVRADMNVAPKIEVPLLVSGASNETKKAIEESHVFLKRMARLSSISFTDTAPPAGSIQCIVDEATLIMPVADIIDLSKERERLQKQIEKLESDIKGIDQKLGNEQFVSNAPEEIVAEFKGRKEQALETIQKLSEALRHLSAA